MTLIWQAAALVVGHFLADFSLQGDTMALEKNPGSTTKLQEAVPWSYWMTAHCLIHAAIVAAVTGSLAFGVIEFAAHFFLDYSKCQRRISIHTDQAGHLITKAIFIWASLT